MNRPLDSAEAREELNGPGRCSIPIQGAAPTLISHARVPYHGCQSARSLHTRNATNVHSPIARRAPANPDANRQTHQHRRASYQFRRNETSEGDSLLRRRPALDAAHDEKRIPGGHRLHGALEPSGRHRCNENETNLKTTAAERNTASLSSFPLPPPDHHSMLNKHNLFPQAPKLLFPFRSTRIQKSTMRKKKLCREEALSEARSLFVVSEKPEPKCVTSCKSATIVDFSEMNVEFSQINVPPQ
jgi:hypothetical protein